MRLQLLVQVWVLEQQLVQEPVQPWEQVRELELVREQVPREQ